MPYNPVPTVATGDLWTASNHNTYIRDNFAAGVPDIFTTKGDLAVASGPNAAGRLAVGSTGQVLAVDASQPLGLKWINGGMHLISEVELAAPAGRVDFTGIPQTYRHLRLMICARTDNAESAALGKLLFNDDAGNTYMTQRTHANDRSLTTFGSVNAYIILFRPEGTPDLANTFGFVVADIFYYRKTGFYKNIWFSGGFVSDGTDTGLSEVHGTAWWKSTSAITKISLLASSYGGTIARNWIAKSVFSLYGVL